MTHRDILMDVTVSVQRSLMCDRDRTGPFYGPRPYCHAFAPGRSVTNVTHVTDVTCPFCNSGCTVTRVTCCDSSDRCHAIGRTRTTAAVRRHAQVHAKLTTEATSPVCLALLRSSIQAPKPPSFVAIYIAAPRTIEPRTGGPRKQRSQK
jgi:hypothetical protein